MSLSIANTKRELVKAALFFIFFLATVFLIRTFIFSPYVVDMSSMYPTLKNADIMIVNKMTYISGGPARGDVIVFDPPSSSGEYVKRVIGLPGEYIDYFDGKFYINGNLMQEDDDKSKTNYIQSYPIKDIQERLTQKLDDDEYYVVGDNRQSSLDSRSFGPIKRKSIVGKVFVTIWPVNRISVIR